MKGTVIPLDLHELYADCKLGMTAAMAKDN